MIPFELDDAARVDGASAVQVYLRLYLPLMTPALAVVGMLDFDALLEADSRWRALTERTGNLRARQRKSSKAPPTPEEIEGLKQLKADLARAEEELAAAGQQRQVLLDRIPNLPDPTAADGMDRGGRAARPGPGERLRSSARSRAITWRSPRPQDGSRHGARGAHCRVAVRVPDR